MIPSLGRLYVQDLTPVRVQQYYGELRRKGLANNTIRKHHVLLHAALGAAVWLQIFWFVIVSVATLVLTRPLVKRYVDSRSVATNADRSIGRAAVVTNENDLIQQVNSFYLAGKECQVYILGRFFIFLFNLVCACLISLGFCGCARLLAAASKRCGKHANSQYKSK